MSLPPDERRLESIRNVWPHVEPARTGSPAQPLHAAADREVDAEPGQVERDDARRLVAVEHHARADFAGAANDRLDVLDLAVLEQDVADRDEQRPLVDGVGDGRVVRDSDDLEIRLCLVEVANGREVRLLVDDPVPLARTREAGEDDRLGDGHVLVHDDGARQRAEDPPELVADRDRHVPPPLGPGPDAALAPCARVFAEVVLRRRGHRGERVVDEVRAGVEDREAAAILGRVDDHDCAARTSSSAA